MPLTKFLGNQRDERHPLSFLVRVPEEPFGGGVPHHDLLVAQVSADDGLVGEHEQATDPELLRDLLARVRHWPSLVVWLLNG